MARMAGDLLRRGGYCWCCNGHDPIGRTAEKRFWRAEADIEATEYLTDRYAEEHSEAMRHGSMWSE